MYTLLRQTYRHLVQQAIVRQEMHLMRPFSRRGMAWETGGVAALFSAVGACGVLAQVHLG